MDLIQFVRLWLNLFEHVYGLISVLIIVFNIQKHFFFWTFETGPI